MQPLYLGVVPAEHTAGVVAALVAAIHNQTDHINCGIIGSRFLLDVLTKHGHGDLALTLATTKTCPVSTQAIVLGSIKRRNVI